MKPTPSPTIRIRTDNLAIARAASGLVSNAALAQKMGVHPTTVARTLTGQAQLGVGFIAGVLGAFPGMQFGDLFAVDTVDDEQTAERIPA